MDKYTPETCANESVTDFLVRILSQDADSMTKALVIVARGGEVEMFHYQGMWDYEVIGLLHEALDARFEDIAVEEE